MSTPTSLTSFAVVPSLGYGMPSIAFSSPPRSARSAAPPPPYAPPTRSAPTHPQHGLATVPADNKSTPPPPYQPSRDTPAQRPSGPKPSSPWGETTPDLIALNAYRNLPARKAWAWWRARRSKVQE